MKTKHAALLAVLCTAVTACQAGKREAIIRGTVLVLPYAPNVELPPDIPKSKPIPGAAEGDLFYHVAVKNFGSTPVPQRYLWVWADITNGQAGNGCRGHSDFTVPPLAPDEVWSPDARLVKGVAGCECRKGQCMGTMWFSLRKAPAITGGPCILHDQPVTGAGPGLSGPNTGIELYWGFELNPVMPGGDTFKIEKQVLDQCVVKPF